MLGQDHVVRALTGAIREDRLHHAFLFCGPRGTGKTSTARILAKMVNCENGPTAEPCGVCDQCVAIREGTHLDVVEIDAASHGGVEDARELRERAPTAPAMGREKVYIIDEAQRLSREAFDALLKVFEEPPAGVRFVLATTEPHKMPATIVGRCQRFDFRRLTMETLAEQLEAIADAEGVTITESAALAIARQAEGSSRDALSLLDQASVLGGETIDDDVVAVAARRAARRGPAVELADAVAVGDARGDRSSSSTGLVQDGPGPPQRDRPRSLAHFRNLLLVQDRARTRRTCSTSRPTAYEQLRAQAEKFTPGELVAGHLAAAGGAERHALDHVAAAHPRAGARSSHDPRDRSQAPAGVGRAPGATRAPRGDRVPGRRRRARGDASPGGGQPRLRTEAASPDARPRRSRLHRRHPPGTRP